MKKLLALVGLLIALPGFPLQLASAAPAVAMLTDTKDFQHSGTLDFRFATPMIASDDVGISVDIKDAPVVITPAVRGNFTWLSRSSGVFSPDDAWPLGGTLIFTRRRRGD